jgi:ABC-2 type transport system permease protein
MSRWKINPVLERELRERPRSTGAAVMLTIFLALLAGVFAIVYLSARSITGTGEVTPTIVANVGRGLFEWVLSIMLLLILFLVPGYTAASITGERERQTLRPMQLTLLRPSRIASGKVTASVAYLGLLVVASAPLLALGYMMGGLSILQVVRGLAALMFIGVVVAAVTVACSTLARRVSTATVLAYTCVLALTFGTAMLWGGASMAIQLNHSTGNPPQALVALNPVVLLAAAVDTANPDQPIPREVPPLGALSGLTLAMHPSQARTSSAFPGPTTGTGTVNPPTPAANTALLPNALVWALVTNTLLGLLAWWLASRRLATPTEFER